MMPGMRISFLAVLLCVATTVQADVFSSYSLSSYVSGKRFNFEITREQVLKTPVWKADVDSPPLAPRKAEQLATEKFRKLITDTEDWKRESITLEDTGDGLHWIYIVAFTKVGAYAGLPPYLRVIVLMDGNVIEPNVSEDS